MNRIEKEKLIKADIASIENRVRHAFNQGYDLGYKDGKSKQANYSEIPAGSTTKNNLGVDCISRQATINAVKRIHPVDTDYDCTLYDKVDVMYVLDEMPSVTPQEPRWIPVKFRPLTDEEKDEYPDYCYMADCPMPDDGEEILVCTMYGGVEKDECIFEDGFYLDSGYDWQTDILAWMPLPQAYSEVEE